MSREVTNLLYLITIVTFILALRFLSNPATARRGNQIGAAGMLVAIVVTFLQKDINSYWEIIVGAMLVAGLDHKDTLTSVIGLIAVVLASANVVGGFVVTDRMLEMFKKREPPQKTDAPHDGQNGT